MSDKLVKQVALKVDFDQISVWRMLDVEKKTEKGRLLKAKAEKDKNIRELDESLKENLNLFA